jgi:hypothetical protein
MEITEQEAYKWAETHRQNTIREIDYLIKDLSEARNRLEKKVGWHIGGNPEIRLRQIMHEGSNAEQMAKLAVWVEMHDKNRSSETV